jgi:hypothetical protein
MSLHKEATVLARDGWWAPAILLSTGHTVHQEFKYTDPAEAQAAAEEWFAKETQADTAAGV